MRASRLAAGGWGWASVWRLAIPKSRAEKERAEKRPDDSSGSMRWYGFMIMVPILDFEFGLQILGGAGADHHLEFSRLDHALHFHVVELEFVRRHLERNRFGFTGGERDAPEIFQLLHRAADGADQVAKVKLNHLVARPVAGIADLHRDGDRLADLAFAGVTWSLS